MLTFLCAADSLLAAQEASQDLLKRAFQFAQVSMEVFVRQHSPGQQQPAVDVKASDAAKGHQTLVLHTAHPDAAALPSSTVLGVSTPGVTPVVVEAPAEASPVLKQELQHKFATVNADMTEDCADFITVVRTDEAEKESTAAASVEPALLLKQDPQCKVASANADVTKERADLSTVGLSDEEVDNNMSAAFGEGALLLQQRAQSKVASAHAAMTEDHAELIAVGHPDEEVNDSMTAASAALVVSSTPAKQPLQSYQSISPKMSSQNAEAEEGEAVPSSMTHSSEIMSAAEELPVPPPACNDQSGEIMEKQEQLIAPPSLPVEVSNSLLLLCCCSRAVQACASLHVGCCVHWRHLAVLPVATLPHIVGCMSC